MLEDCVCNAILNSQAFQNPFSSPMVKKLIQLLLGILLFHIVIVLFNTFTFKSKQIKVESLPPFEVNNSAVQNFASTLAFKTISQDEDGQFHPEAFSALRNFLKSTYPLIDLYLQRELINEYSLLYKWKGKNPDLNPVIFIAHQDVVPVESTTLEKWKVAPFTGEVNHQYIWGRGSLDMKVVLVSLMEAIEQLLQENYQPERDIYLAFGHDEEIGGENGGKKIAEALEKRGIMAEFIMDEGGAMSQGLIPNIDLPVAMVGIAEKGYLTLELRVENIEGGHAAKPTNETAIGILSNAIVKLENNQMPLKVSQPLRELVTAMGPEMPFLEKTVFANLWLFEGFIQDFYADDPGGNAVLRTTVAPTIFQSGLQDNILPTEARATVNFRILPGETAEEVLEHAKAVIADKRVKIIPGSFVAEPSPVSSTQSKGFKTISKTIRQHFPETVVVPFLVIGGTDSKHFYKVTKDIYRFLPVKFGEGDLQRIHGINERISIEAYKQCIRFYYQLIKNIDEDESNNP